MKDILRLWGCLCLFFAAAFLGLSLYAASRPSMSFNPGSTGLGEWIGMGLLSLGLAQAIELLEKK